MYLNLAHSALLTGCLVWNNNNSGTREDKTSSSSSILLGLDLHLTVWEIKRILMILKKDTWNEGARYEVLVIIKFSKPQSECNDRYPESFDKCARLSYIFQMNCTGSILLYL